METLADYGTVQYFGVSTFTTGIFAPGLGWDDSPAAAQLASVLLGFVFTLILLERYSRRKMRFHHTGQKNITVCRVRTLKVAGVACLFDLFDRLPVGLFDSRRFAGGVELDHL